MNQLCDEYLVHLRRRHDHEWQANNLGRIEQGLKPLRELHGPDDAAAFGPLKLEAVRERMIESGRLCRPEINSRVQTIRRAFKWGVARERLPRDLAHALEAVEHLKKGDFGTREGREVRPVDRATVDATLPHLPRPVAALVELMWWTCRWRAVHVRR